jgi:integrase
MRHPLTGRAFRWCCGLYVRARTASFRDTVRRRLRVRLHQNACVRSARHTVCPTVVLDDMGGGDERTIAHLFDEFLSFSAARGRSPTTLHWYRVAINGFWVPEIGDLALGELTTHTLDSIYARLLTRAKPAAPSTVRRYHAILSAALTQAVKWQWIASNPARLATLPSARPSDPTAPTLDEVRDLMEACRSRSELLGAIVSVAAATGCRRGELAALKWCDYADHALHIRGSAYNLGSRNGVKETKTGRHRRVVVLGELEAVLEQWQRRCELLADEAGVALAPDAFVFSPTPGGVTPVNVNTVSSQFRRVASTLGLDHVHFHSLRHFAATQLISSGVDPRTAASRLGHANPALTLRVYAHATTESERAAAEIGSAVLARAHPTPLKAGPRRPGNTASP